MEETIGQGRRRGRTLCSHMQQKEETRKGRYGAGREGTRHGGKARKGKVLVTGAGGGVGSFAVAILASLGYSVTASTGRAAELRPYLADLGAHRVIGRLSNDRDLLSEKWAGVVDSVGGETLAAALAATRYGRAVACPGVAGGGQVPTTVYPFILRGVRLLGIDSVRLPMAARLEVWRRLAEDLPRDKLPAIVSDTIPLARVPAISHSICSGKAPRGRLVVDVARAA
mmetsp:Transcript_9901/g.28324  ORF Transcript_9901/g.28324 Transcript_9901/m.28324 type:complete len:227 (-) Transcript_9901:119-799(-)